MIRNQSEKSAGKVMKKPRREKEKLIKMMNEMMDEIMEKSRKNKNRTGGRDHGWIKSTCRR